MYKIVLADGTTLEDLELNGDNFIPQSMNKDIFEDNLSRVIITDSDGKSQEYEDMKVIFARIGEQETFVLAEKTQAEKERERVLSLIADLTEIVLLGGEG